MMPQKKLHEASLVCGFLLIIACTMFALVGYRGRTASKLQTSQTSQIAQLLKAQALFNSEAHLDEVLAKPLHRTLKLDNAQISSLANKVAKDRKRLSSLNDRIR
mmetsp:Transcript_21694/g.71766  ORF Transcript_21694/g.71766 Transcript_21694/m.71766 type:complete len:104 (+) Transcript_21694:41-352(+)